MAPGVSRSPPFSGRVQRGSAAVWTLAAGFDQRTWWIYGVLSIKNGDLMGLNMGFKGFPKSWVKKYEGLKRIHRWSRSGCIYMPWGGFLRIKHDQTMINRPYWDVIMIKSADSDGIEPVNKVWAYLDKTINRTHLRISQHIITVITYYNISKTRNSRDKQQTVDLLLIQRLKPRIPSESIGSTWPVDLKWTKITTVPGLVNLQKTMERSTIFNGKSAVNGPFSIAMLVYQRVIDCVEPLQALWSDRILQLPG